jgi:aarF domain-containing kinase
VIWAATGTGVATGVLAGVLAFGDQIKYSYDAAERTGRVASGLAICINEYESLPKL